MKYQLSVSLFSAMCLSAVSMAAIAPTDADHPVQLGTPIFGGAGCPARSSSASVTPGEQEFDITSTLKPSSARAGGGTGRQTAVDACNMVIPISVAEGYQAALTSAKFEGSYDLPRGSKAVLHTERFVAGGTGLRHDQELVAPRGGLSGSFENEMSPGDAIWTSCKGGGYNLRANTSMVLTNPSKLKVAMISMGRPNTKKTEMQYKVEWRHCRQ